MMSSSVPGPAIGMMFMWILRKPAITGTAQIFMTITMIAPTTTVKAPVPTEITIPTIPAPLPPTAMPGFPLLRDGAIASAAAAMPTTDGS